MCPRRLPLTCALLALAMGCGGAQRGAGEGYGGSVTEPPRMEVLPSPVEPQERWTERMRFAYLLAEESFDLAPPEPPLTPSVAELQEWSDTALTEWLERKAATLEAARAELDEAAEESHRQRIMAGAIVGLMYEDVARTLLDVPVPHELWEEPDIAQIYREIVDFQARPFLEHARRAYRACALNAQRRPAGLGHWSDFCAGRGDLLPASGSAAGAAEQGTTVEVVRE